MALITELFSPYMEPRCYVSRGKTGEDETGKRDYRHRARTGRGDKEVVIDRWEWPITENIGNLGKVKEAVTLKHGILTGISLSGEEIFSPIEVKSVRTSGVLPASRNCLLTRATLCCRSAERG